MPQVLDEQPDRLPTNSYDLIRYLDREYPARCIQIGESEIHAHRYAGTRALIEVLIDQMRHEIAEIDEAKRRDAGGI